MAAARARFRSLAWGTLAYTVLVILFGAVVRITGSGAGCGQHWPTCHGEIVPISPTIETIIEFSHRVTSGLCGIIVLALLIAALRGFPRGHTARVGAWLALVFTITEALIGAGLVRFGLVGHNDSVARAVVMAAHLLNTSLLTGAIALTAWAAGRDPGAVTRSGASRRVRWLLGASLGGLVLVGLSGAVTALGDTLYPVEAGALAERLQRDLGAGAHFLQRLRLMHPVLACGLGFFTAVIAHHLGNTAAPAVRRASAWVMILVFAQLAAGVLNVMLSAPGWMQVLHLGLGTALWVAAVLFSLELLYAQTGLDGRARPDR
ncbi:COX15/CtaA family protein [Nannocystis bainbridge]|uniref:COX15/CtaA family protein n=1 Tax=Nannocystis bainbridge TaxID=2995303 RepID=A0ABT5E253_9BACT|nr:COX15/CtaA family protein [Nannocystis bainbridge]MDC0719886.1 COX15/CtaA family protein [Nannocystis bainbridge]